VATQFERDAEDVKKFCHERIPDGIIRLAQSGKIFELAVEVETTVRNQQRVKEVLLNYEETFSPAFSCSGVLIVCCTPGIATVYRKVLASLSSETQRSVRIFESPRLEGLNEESFGRSGQGLESKLELTQTVSDREILYTNEKSATYLPMAAPIRAGTAYLGNS